MNWGLGDSNSYRQFFIIYLKCVVTVYTLCYYTNGKGEFVNMRKKKQYNFTLPDITIEQMDKLIELRPIEYINRSVIISKAIDFIYNENEKYLTGKDIYNKI